jgi:hypothetical protein
MNKVFFYGNCQIASINTILSINKGLKQSLLPCWQDFTKEEFLDLIKSSDVIITQPIRKNYKEKDYTHTEFILENSNRDTKIIIVPSLYFNFYYFDLTYKFFKEESDKKPLKDPSDYHYHSIIKSYNNNEKIKSVFENYIDNENLKSKDELEGIADQSIKELISREIEMLKYKDIRDCSIVTISDFIKNNYKKKLLFYSMNHPSKHVFHHVVDQIKKVLNIDENNEVDPLRDDYRGILYRCIQKVVEFNIEEEKPKLLDINDPRMIVEQYYKTYDDKKLRNKFL